MGNAAPSWPPLPARPVTSVQPALRAKSLGKLRLPARQAAREFGAVQARTGALVLTVGEVAFLLPLDVAFGHLAECLRERVARESTSGAGTPEDTVRFRMALMHLDSLSALLR